MNAPSSTFANATAASSSEITLGWNSMSAFGSAIPQPQSSLDELVEFTRATSAPKKGLVSSLASFWNAASQAAETRETLAWA